MLDAMALLGWREARPDMNWDAFQPASGPVDVVPANEILARIQAKRQEPEGKCIPFPVSTDDIVECVIEGFDDEFRMIARNGGDIPEEILQRMKRDRLKALAAKRSDHEDD
jgi:hypothetical protein